MRGVSLGPKEASHQAPSPPPTRTRPGTRPGSGPRRGLRAPRSSKIVPSPTLTFLTIGEGASYNCYVRLSDARAGFLDRQAMKKLHCLLGGSVAPRALNVARNRPQAASEAP